MSSKTESSPESPHPKKKRGRLHLSTVIAAVVALPMVGLAIPLGKSWYAVSTHLTTLQQELETLTKRNGVLVRVHEATQQSRFQVCNKTAGDVVVVPWIAAAYYDGKQLQLFDSARCQGFRGFQLAAGDSRLVTLSSPEEGCNWNGSVLLYSMHIAREADEQTMAYNVAGTWRGFDRDCFTVQ
jgi:hypothetical protein